MAKDSSTNFKTGFLQGSLGVVACLAGKKSDVKIVLLTLLPGLKLAYRERKLPRFSSLALIFTIGLLVGGVRGYNTRLQYLDELAQMDHKRSPLSNAFKMMMKYAFYKKTRRKKEEEKLQIPRRKRHFKGKEKGKKRKSK